MPGASTGTVMSAFTLEVLSLYIPDLVESDELERIARDLSEIDPLIPFTILAFFPEHKMKDFRSPSTKEMVESYKKVKAAGLKRIRLGNMGVFVRNKKDRDFLTANVDSNALLTGLSNCLPGPAFFDNQDTRPFRRQS